MCWALLLLLLLSILIVLDYAIKRKRYSLTKNIPGPRVYPILGSLFIFQLKNGEDLFKNVIQSLHKYGSTVRVWAFNRIIFVSSDPKLVEIILRSPKYIRKHIGYDILTLWLGNGLLLSNGKKWFQRRKLLTPTFHFKILEGYVETFDEQSSILVENMQVHVNQGEFDIHPILHLAALDIVSETTMGIKIQAQKNPKCEYVHAVQEMTEIFMTRAIMIHLANQWIFKLLRPELKRKQDSAKKTLHEFTTRIIEERRRMLLENNSNNENHLVHARIKPKLAFLDVLLQATIEGQPLTNSDIREEVDTFMLAGHDTVSAGMAYALYCISRHPQVQEKIFEEIRTFIGDNKDKPIGFKELNDLKYLEYAIKESLRLYPPAPMVGRNLDENVEIDGTVLPAGSELIIPIFLLHKNPEHFPDPERYYPERHINVIKTNSYNYIPFSAGPRNCIGQKFAMLQMKCLVSKVLRYYELVPLGPDPIVVFNVLLRTKNGIRLGIRPRTYR